MTAKTFCITGASSGIGLQLARELAKRGHHLALLARNEKVLSEAIDQLSRLYPSQRFVKAVVDVRDYSQVEHCILTLDQQMGPFDVVVANAAIASSSPIGHGGFEQPRAIIETNVIGAMATIETAMTLFRQRNHGHIVGISSIAGERGLANNGAYSASKAAMSRYLEALRGETHTSPIQVTEIEPGFIDTPINRELKRRPFVITVERGSRMIANHIEQATPLAVVPYFPWAAVRWLLKLLPGFILARIQKQ